MSLLVEFNLVGGSFTGQDNLNFYCLSLLLNDYSAGTVHSKCSSTGSACPVAIGHRDSIQQEMLKRYLSDLLGELCLFASVVPPVERQRQGCWYMYWTRAVGQVSHTHTEDRKCTTVRMGAQCRTHAAATWSRRQPRRLLHGCRRSKGSKGTPEEG